MFKLGSRGYWLLGHCLVALNYAENKVYFNFFYKEYIYINIEKIQGLLYLWGKHKVYKVAMEFVHLRILFDFQHINKSTYKYWIISRQSQRTKVLSD
jgi:hypothetical protein